MDSDIDLELDKPADERDQQSGLPHKQHNDETQQVAYQAGKVTAHAQSSGAASGEHLRARGKRHGGLHRRARNG
jgi:hypothetical protein